MWAMLFNYEYIRAWVNQIKDFTEANFRQHKQDNIIADESTLSRVIKHSHDSN